MDLTARFHLATLFRSAFPLSVVFPPRRLETLPGCVDGWGMMLQNADNARPIRPGRDHATPPGTARTSHDPLSHLQRVLKQVEESLPDSESLAARINGIRQELTSLIGLLVHDYAPMAHAHRSDLTDGRAMLRDVVTWANLVLPRAGRAANIKVDIDLDPALELLPATAPIGAMLNRVETVLHRVANSAEAAIHLRIERSDLNVRVTMSATRNEILDLMTTCLEEDGVHPHAASPAGHLPKWCQLIQALGGSVVYDFASEGTGAPAICVLYPITHGIGFAEAIGEECESARLHAA